MSFDLPRYWYRPSLHIITAILLPISWLFGSVAALRRWLYRVNIMKTVKVDAPVIVVGNITAGGTGKTPFVIWLADFLRQHGYRPGIVSRGVGGAKCLRPYYVQQDDAASVVGDEALLLIKKTGCPLVIGADRAAAAQTLLQHAVCNIIISDDGLQHYRLSRDIEIVLVDGTRRFGNQRLLPAGPLREPVKRLQQVDMVVVNGNDETDAFKVSFEPGLFISLKDSSKQQSLQAFKGQTVHAVAGIGHPERYFLLLERAGIIIIPHVFPDHHPFKPADLAFADNLPILMTEKDAVKCTAFADERYFALTIAAKVDQSLEQSLLALLQNNI